MEYVHLTGSNCRLATDQKEEGKTSVSCLGYAAVWSVPLTDRSREDNAGLKGTMKVGVTEEGRCKGQISSRDLGMAGGIRDEGSNILQRGMGTSSTWPTVPDYFRKPTERPVGERAPLGFSDDASGGAKQRTGGGRGGRARRFNVMRKPNEKKQARPG